MAWTTFHTHCSYCDGTDTLDNYLKKAVALEMPSYGVSCHAPMPSTLPWTMPEPKLPDYLSEIRRLRTQWQNEIELYAGLEIDFVPGLSWWDQIGPLYRDLDYVVGSIHLVDTFDDGRPWEIDGSHETFLEGLRQIFKGDIRAAVSRYFELTRWMVMLENPDLVGHLDKIKIQNVGGFFFSETESWYRHEIDKTLKVIANTGAIVEVNTRGLYTGKSLDLYPSQWVLERIHAMNIPISLNSDAHHPNEIIGGFDFAAKILRKIGFKKVCSLIEGKWREVPFSEKGLDLPWKKGNKSQSA